MRSDIRTFQALFCAYATVINETPCEVEATMLPLLYCNLGGHFYLIVGHCFVFVNCGTLSSSVLLRFDSLLGLIT